MMLVDEKILVKSGDAAPESGYYLYKGNPDPEILPCKPTEEERILTLASGDLIPHIESCSNHAALYKLVMRIE